MNLQHFGFFRCIYFIYSVCSVGVFLVSHLVSLSADSCLPRKAFYLSPLEPWVPHSLFLTHLFLSKFYGRTEILAEGGKQFLAKAAVGSEWSWSTLTFSLWNRPPAFAVPGSVSPSQIPAPDTSAQFHSPLYSFNTRETFSRLWGNSNGW